MSRDDIIRMAQEAGISTGGHPMNPWNVYPSDLEHFAALVAAAEREACAQVCDERVKGYQYETDIYASEHINEAKQCAAAIRARGE